MQDDIREDIAATAMAAIALSTPGLEGDEIAATANRVLAWLEAVRQADAAFQDRLGPDWQH